MTTPTAAPELDRCIRGAEVRRTVEAACRENRHVEIGNPDNPHVSAREIGTLIPPGTERTTLAIATIAPLHPDSPGTVFDISFENDTQRFSFRAKLIAAPKNAETSGYVFALPTSLRVLDRRRFPRRQLRNQSLVVVRSVDSDPCWSTAGPLMNLSVSGLAFRLNARKPKALSVGVTVRAALMEPGDDAPDRGDTHGTTLLARIANITQGADPERWVIGIEFLLQEATSETREHLAALVRGSRKE